MELKRVVRPVATEPPQLGLSDSNGMKCFPRYFISNLELLSVAKNSLLKMFYIFPQLFTCPQRETCEPYLEKDNGRDECTT